MEIIASIEYYVLWIKKHAEAILQYALRVLCFFCIEGWLSQFNSHMLRALSYN